MYEWWGWKADRCIWEGRLNGDFRARRGKVDSKIKQPEKLSPYFIEKRNNYF